MSDVIITTDDLLDYLKIPDFDSRQNQEVNILKITQQATFTEEFKEFTTFQNTYDEVSIPQTIYMDADNVGYIIHRFSDEDIYYKLISYQKDERVFSGASFSSPLVELFIPDEIYNGGYQFYINKEYQLVASVEAVTISNTKNYISYSPQTFSYLKQYPSLSYTYQNVYGASVAENIQITSYDKKGPVHRFPILSRTGLGAYTYRLSYYYKENSAEIRNIRVAEQDGSFIGFSILLKDITSVLSILNNTIFWFYNEYNDYRSSWRNRFLNTLTSYVVEPLNASGNNKQKVCIIYHLPQPMYFAFDRIESLWVLLHKLAKGYVRNNLSINEEDLILKVLRILYHRKIHRRSAFLIHGTERFEEVTQANIKSNNEFIANLITRKVDNTLLLYKLITGLDGQQFRAYINFIWNIWKHSSYSVIDPQQNEKIKITEKSPVLLDYRSNKTLGFYTDNASIVWEGVEPDITISVKTKTDTKEETETFNIGDFEKPLLLIEVPKKEAYDIYTYHYHPFSPILIQNSENPKFLLKDNDDQNIFVTKLPAFVLFANQETAFWQNIMTSLEYGIDIITTVSGFGNIIKAGRIFNLLKGSKTLFYRTAQATKVIGAVKATVGIIEVSSGTVNALLKLTGTNDTKLGKSISKYLFYLEMLALAGEITAAIRDGLQKSAKELLEQRKELARKLDEAIANSKNSPFPFTVQDKRRLFREIEKVNGVELGASLKEYVKFRPKFLFSVAETTRLWRAKSLVKITEVELVDVFTKRLDDFPGLVKGHNQAEFNIKFLDNGKPFDEVGEFSFSGSRKDIFERFGNPPKLPENTIDIFEDYDGFTKFVTGVFDFGGRPRKFDSEIKFIYNFLRNHINKADEFVIETKNIFATCSSCSREFVMLEEYMKSIGKKVKFIVKTDEDVSGMTSLMRNYPELKPIKKKFEKIYRKNKKNK
ncbi:hypothetical protein [Tenacibaculum agarivorans]|uniref:hypothetical protein n=1 Tax=Tenacibaculum agarivorans TaxID=1908389 RepID=UPI00094BC326|nr:hypothetical protein [Tenacibaculum agarivorans]